MNCVVCNKINSDVHHIKSRGSGGGDEPFNLVYLCRMHHSELHQIGTHSFATKYQKFMEYLEDNDWEFMFLFGKYKLTRNK